MATNTTSPHYQNLLGNCTRKSGAIADNHVRAASSKRDSIDKGGALPAKFDMLLIESAKQKPSCPRWPRLKLLPR
jgi:hypothetical protein